MKQTQNFTKSALNSDVSPNFMPNGESDLFENCMEYEKGVISNQLGNTIIKRLPHYSWGHYNIIGSCKYTSKNSIIVFCCFTITGINFGDIVYATNEILRYELDSGNIVDVLREYTYTIQPIGVINPPHVPIPNNISLGWTYNHKILNAKVVDDKLYWTDPIPRYVDIQKSENTCDIINAFLNGGSPNPNDYMPFYTEITNQIISFDKQPPVSSPTCTYVSDKFKVYNYLRGHLFKYAYRYLYYNNDYSIYSPQSQVPLPQGENFIDFTGNYISYIDDVTLNNTISIGYNTGNSNVKKIEIVGQMDGGLWFLIDSIDPGQPNTPLFYSFSNDETYFQVDQTEIEVQYHDVPIEANEMEVTDSDMMVFGDITEGENLTTIDIEFTEIFTPVRQGVFETVFESTQNCSQLDYYKHTTSTEFKHFVFWVLPIPDLIYLKSTYVIEIRLQLNNSNTIYLVTYPIVLADLPYDAASNPNGDYSFPQVLSHNIADRINNEAIANGWWTFDTNNYDSLLHCNRWGYALNGSLSLSSFNVDGTDLNYDTYGAFANYIPVWRNATKTLGINYPNYAEIASANGGVYNYFLTFCRHMRTEDWWFGSPNAIVGDGIMESSGAETEIFTFVSLAVYGTDSDANVNYKSLKKGVPRSIGLVYSDEFGRMAGVENPQIAISAPIQGVPASDLRLQYISEYEFKINSLPPNWATRYSIVSSNPQLQFVQFPTLDIQASPDGNKAPVGVKINTGIISLVKANPKTIIQAWVFEAGDRMRFVSYWDQSNSDPSKHQWRVWYPNTVYDAEITGYDDKNDWFLMDDLGGLSLHDWDHTNTLTHKYEQLFVEIYRPSKPITTNSNVYCEIATYPLVTLFGLPVNSQFSGIRYHGMGGLPTIGIDPLTGASITPTDMPQNQTANQPCVGYINSGEVYLRLRETGNEYGSFISCEDVNFSDFYKSDVHDYGKSYGVVEEMVQKRYKNMIRYGGKLLEGTLTNEINNFEDIGYDMLPAEFGAITGIRQRGFVLKVIQEKKTTSYYLNRTVVKEASIPGQTILAEAEAVLGSREIAKDDYGCQNPESILSKDEYIYFWDAISGAMIRNSENGNYPISHYGMDIAFLDISKQLKSLTGVKVYTGFDEAYNLLYVTFVNEGTGIFNNITLSFDEGGHQGDMGANRWKSYHSFIPEGYVNLGNDLFTFNSGNIWQQESGTVYNNFFGVQYSLKLRLYFSENPLNNKIFQSLAIDTNRTNYVGDNTRWIVTNMYTIPNDMYPQGMTTNIQMLRPKEGKLYSAIPRDLNSPMAGTAAFKKLNGRVMRGEILVVEMECWHNESVTVKSVDLNYALSKSGA